MNKMLQIWKFFITETNSHHTIQIFKSFFIFVQYVIKKNNTYFRINAQKHAKIMTFIMYSSTILCQK